jgi:hypothetical protein
MSEPQWKVPPGKHADHSQWIGGSAIDPSPSPLDAMIAAEEKSDAWVYQFLMGCRAWPAPNDAQGRCGVCHDLPKRPGVYCGACDRPKGTGARRGAKSLPPMRVKGGKRVKDRPETRKERRERKREAA